MPLHKLAIIPFLLFGWAISACAKTAISADGGTTEAGAAVLCPSTIPTTSGGSCSTGLYCEYGSDPAVDCNRVVPCFDGGWVIETHDDAGCGNQSPPSCPTTYDTLAIGEVCSGPAVECYYPEARCLCSFGGGDCDKPDCGSPTWTCHLPPEDAGCPVPRPRLGSPCNHSGEVCDYGACMTDPGIRIRCTPDLGWEPEELTNGDCP